MDNTWILEIGGIRILVDPWLEGDEVDYFPWFNKQWHKTKPVEVKDVGEFDFVLITQKYPDHFHLRTLRKLAPNKIVGPSSIRKKLEKYFPGAQIASFNENLKSVFGLTLNIHIVPTSRKIDPIYDALTIDDGKESVFLATHGCTNIDKWNDLITTLPPCKLVLTPLNEYKLPTILGGTVAPGIQAAKNLVNFLEAEYIIATHDEDKHASGLVSRFAQIKYSPKIDELSEDIDLKDRIIELNDYKVHEL